MPTVYLGHPHWWSEYERCRVLTGPTLPVLSYYSNLVLGQKLWQGLCGASMSSRLPF